MVDVAVIKSLTDCRELIARDLGESKVRSPRYVTYPCPLHHETKGRSLVVYSDGWHCHGKCQRSGDAISWLELYHGMSFVEATQALAGNLVNVPVRRPAMPPAPEPAEPPSAAWQQRARAVMVRAQDVLWSDQGGPGRDYLASRGILPRIAKAACLGFIPGDSSKPYRIDGIGNIYPGIVIPWEAGGHLWALNVRRLNVTDDRGKYLLAEGSRRRGALYGADAIDDLPVVFVEGEFDALIIRQSADDLVAAVTLGSAAARLDARWFDRFWRPRSILIATDSDEAGERARDRLAALSARARVLRVPDDHKDVSDFYNAAARGSGRVWDWLFDEVRDDLPTIGGVK